jgi:O-antigen biosynthesis protein
MKFDLVPENSIVHTLMFIADLAGCGTIRVILPTILLNQWNHRPQIHQYFLNCFTKDLAMYKDAAYVSFQRSATAKHLELIDLFRRKIKPLTKTGLIYESDDYLIDIPEWNFAAEYYNKNRTYIIEMLKIVDGVTVSTPKLKELYSQFNENVSVIPNHLCKFIWKSPQPVIKDTKRLRILYPCSSNHFALPRMKMKGGDIGDVLINYIRKTADEHEWVFIGAYPKEIKDLIDSGKITWHKWKSIYEYPDFLKSLDGDIGVAPLENNVFNDCKSNIKVLEYSALGIPGVYSNVYPYKDCTMKADTEEEFISKIEELKSADMRLQVCNKDYNFIKEQLFWEEHDNILKYVNAHLNLFGKETK